MAIFLVNDKTRILIDNAVGTPKNLDTFADQIEGVGKSYDMLESTVLSETAPSFIAGLEEVRAIIIRGPFDDGVDVDGLYVGRLGLTTAFTQEILVDGSRSFSFEGFLKRYDYIVSSKSLVKYEAEFIPTGGITIRSTPLP